MRLQSYSYLNSKYLWFVSSRGASRYTGTDVRHVEQGHKLETPDDVPEEIRQQLYTEEQQRLERHQRGPNISSSNLPPIYITNMLPTSSSQASNQLSSVSTPAHTV
jgi:hypothetical protein